MNITKVSLQTHKLGEMYDFYKDRLGCTIEKESANCFEIRFGSTIVEFHDRHVYGEPFYHFAFDIPANQFSEAKQWATKRVTLSTEDGKDEVYFENIVANSLYFEDPSGNIVEFISRTEDNPKNDIPFSIKNIIKMSEMSLVVEDKITVAEKLAEVGIRDRNGDQVPPHSLSFLGSHNIPVYLLLVSPKRIWYFSNKEAAVFPLAIHLDSDVQLEINDRHEFHISTNY